MKGSGMNDCLCLYVTKRGKKKSKLFFSRNHDKMAGDLQKWAMGNYTLKTFPCTL